MDAEKLEKEVQEELTDLGITPRFETIEEFDQFFNDENSVLVL